MHTNCRRIIAGCQIFPAMATCGARLGVFLFLCVCVCVCVFFFLFFFCFFFFVCFFFCFVFKYVKQTRFVTWKTRDHDYHANSKSIDTSHVRVWSKSMENKGNNKPQVREPRLRSCSSSPFWKEFYSKRKRVAFLAFFLLRLDTSHTNSFFQCRPANSFLLKLDPFSEGGTQFWYLLPLKVYLFPWRFTFVFLFQEISASLCQILSTEVNKMVIKKQNGFSICNVFFVSKGNPFFFSKNLPTEYSVLVEAVIPSKHST